MSLLRIFYRKYSQHFSEEFNVFLIFIVFCIIFNKIENQMNQSEKFIKLQKILTEDPSIRTLLQNSLHLARQYINLGVQSFISTKDLQVLAEELNKLKIPQINYILSQLKLPHAIVAFPIHKTDKFTLFFVIVPPHRKFDWHSHPKMGGISKCCHGHLNISTIDMKELQFYNYNTYLYPKNKMRFQSIKCNDQQTVSVISPEVYNVHKIEAVQLSAFFDLLMPDYPDNACQFFRTIDENGESLLLQEMESESEQIIGWDIYYEQLLNSQKHIVKNYILK